MIADSLITPPISVMSAVEGSQALRSDIPVVGITIVIIVILFLFQQTGTQIIGKFFGPAMVLWFGMIAILGAINLADDPTVLRAINPWYAYELLTRYPGGFWVLGGVFLCTTGAEALYADMGHVGRRNIQIAWIFIKISLLLCYFGEAALLLQHRGETLADVHAFFGMAPRWFLLPCIAIAIATAATVIASQALISGTYTLFNEAMRLNLWPRLRVEFPTEWKGQIYVPVINWLMMFGCIGMVLYFRESANMEAAFGLSVTLTMLITTVLLGVYLYTRKTSLLAVVVLATFYLAVEGRFLAANLAKFTHGGWITLLTGSLLISIIYIWYAGKRLKNRYKKFVPLKSCLPQLKQLSEDTSVPKLSTHLVYLTLSPKSSSIEERSLKSIFLHQPKRAETYWFVHVDVDDAPYTLLYHVEEVAADDVIYVRFRLGFRIVPRVNLLFRQVVEKMMAKGQVQVEEGYRLHKQQAFTGDFRYVLIKSTLSVENNLSFRDNFIMRSFFILDMPSQSDESAFGLDDSNVLVEKDPLVLGPVPHYELEEDK